MEDERVAAVCDRALWRGTHRLAIMIEVGLRRGAVEVEIVASVGIEWCQWGQHHQRH